MAKRLSEDRCREIEMLCDTYDDLPDGAFLAVLEERGVTVEDLYQHHLQTQGQPGQDREPEP